MPDYEVMIEAEFTTSSLNTTALRQRLVRVIKQEGFNEKNFEISIIPKKKKETILDKISNEQAKDATTKVQKDSKSKSRAKRIQRSKSRRRN